MFPRHEGSMSIVVMRDDAAPSGPMAGSRMEGNHRNMRGPTGSAGLVPVGDSGKALPEPRSELRSGVGLVHTTCEIVEGNETHEERDQPEGSLREKARAWTQSRVVLPPTHKRVNVAPSQAAQTRFTPQLHHVDEDALLRAFRRQKR